MKNLITLAAILIFTSLSIEANDTNLWPAEKIQRSRECIFEIVAKKMNVQINPSKKRPALKVQGTTSLEEYQDAMEKFWGWRPSGIINAFNPVTNEIYLYAVAEYYLSRERTIFDSLVHEYSHYFQLNYLGRDLEDEYNENEAVEIQTWFRSEYASSIKGFDFNCSGSNLLTVKGGTEFEIAETKIAYQKLINYFAQAKITLSPKITVVFEDEVFLPSDNQKERTQVYGYFDTDKLEIHMMHFNSQTERFPWGVEWSNDLAGSFLLHELTHLMTVSALGLDFKKIERAWHELIAYGVQFELMPDKVRNDILRNYPEADQGPFEDYGSVNAMTYGVAPESFAVRSFRSFGHWGGVAFLKKLLSGQISLPTPSE